MTQNIQKAASAPQLDRADARVRHDAGLSGALRGFIDQVRSGDLGMLPVVIGLLLISTVFSILNPVFLAPANLVNLLFDAAAVGLIADRGGRAVAKAAAGLRVRDALPRCRVDDHHTAVAHGGGDLRQGDRRCRADR